MPSLAQIATYFPAVGLVGLAVYHLSVGDYSSAGQDVLGALAVFGIGSTVHAVNNTINPPLI